MGAKSKWTKEETDYLVKNYKNMTYGEMSKYIDKSVKQISSKVYLLGLSKRKDDWWTDEDIKYLVHIISNSPNMLKDVQKEFNKNNINSNIYIKQNGNYKLGIYNFKDLTMLHSYFYDDATIFMERKYLKSQNILKLPSK